MVFVVTAVLLVISASVSAQYTNVNTCEEGVLPEVKFISNNTLCLEGPCEVNPGTDVTLNFVFTSPKYLENIKANAKATALGVVVDYPLFENSACDGIVNTYCPLVANEKVEYLHVMHLLDVFPEISLGLKFSIMDLDDNNADAVCFNLELQVVKL